MRLAEYWTTENADPRHVYHDVLVAIDAGLAQPAGGRERPSAGPADQCGEVGRFPAYHPTGRRNAAIIRPGSPVTSGSSRASAVAILCAEARLKEALAKSPLTAVRSLRREPEEPDWSCWLSGDRWWLFGRFLPRERCRNQGLALCGGVAAKKTGRATRHGSGTFAAQCTTKLSCWRDRSQQRSIKRR